MPQYISITLDGVGTFRKRINKVNSNINDLRKPFKEIAQDFRDTERKVFNGQGAYGSRPRWASLTSIYAEHKARDFPGKPILQRKGDLMASLTTKSGNHIEQITENYLRIGSKDPKFKFHQRGTKKMVARPPITFTKYQGDKWSKIVIKHISDI